MSFREMKVEFMKMRYRKAGLMVAMLVGLLLVYELWGLRQAHAEELMDGYLRLFLDLPLINTILMPTFLAMLESRLCDAEIKGNMLKLLCTMERKGRLFDKKLLLGMIYLLLIIGIQVVMVLLLGLAFGFSNPLKGILLIQFIVQLFLPCLAILILQQTLSFFFENQIIPLAVGLLGSFIGLFSWFFPGQAFRFAFIWAYYTLLGFINYDWDETTRIITYYEVDFSWALAGGLALFILAGYFVARAMFVRKEI